MLAARTGRVEAIEALLKAAEPPLRPGVVRGVAAAQSKSMDAMVEVSETVAIACSNCHEPYRDFDDPNDRCSPREGGVATAE